MSILFDAVCDYMDTVDRPSDVLRQCMTLSTNEMNVLIDAEKLAEILMQIRIKMIMVAILMVSVNICQRMLWKVYQYSLMHL